MDYVPTKLLDTVYMETVSDDWFVDLNSDGLPQMAIGRLPDQTTEETAKVLSKIAGYEKSSSNQEALLVADNSDDLTLGGFGRIEGLVTGLYHSEKDFPGDFSSDARAKSVLLSGINQGPLLVNFFAHGSVEIWRGTFWPTMMWRPLSMVIDYLSLSA